MYCIVVQAVNLAETFRRNNPIAAFRTIGQRWMQTYYLAKMCFFVWAFTQTKMLVKHSKSALYSAKQHASKAYTEISKSAAGDVLGHVEDLYKQQSEPPQ